jgi:hypothetical protein
VTAFYDYYLLEPDKYLAHMRTLLTTAGLCKQPQQPNSADEYWCFSRLFMSFPIVA